MAYFKLLIVISAVFNIALAAIDSELMTTLRSGGAPDVLISFVGENDEPIRSIKLTTFSTRSDKVKALTSALQAHSQNIQAEVQTFLDKEENVKSETFWVSNQMVIRNAPLALLKQVKGFKDVKRIQTLPTIKLDPTPEGTAPAGDGSVEYGIAKIQADKTWEQSGTRGEGVVVANIDTGVRGTHEALVSNFRQDHGWFDPYTSTKKSTDGNGHGTHTMGTIAGSKGIGVAPGAKWIACRGCDSDSCDGAKLIGCGQWMVSPTKPDGTDPRPDLCPDVVSNSWGDSLGQNTFFNPTIKAWEAAGILHCFAIGNSGPACQSAGSPGDQTQTCGVGSTDESDQLSVFSSKGPAEGAAFKPDIVAPGSDIRSAWFDGDQSYNTISGTSMSTPHLAGVMALMLSAHKIKVGDPGAKLTQSQVVQILKDTAVKEGLSVSALNVPCETLPGGDITLPNNEFGHGRVDCFAAVEAVKNGKTSKSDEASTSFSSKKAKKNAKKFRSSKLLPF